MGKIAASPFYGDQNRERVHVPDFGGGKYVDTPILRLRPPPGAEEQTFNALKNASYEVRRGRNRSKELITCNSRTPV